MNFVWCVSLHVFFIVNTKTSGSLSCSLGLKWVDIIIKAGGPRS